MKLKLKRISIIMAFLLIFDIASSVTGFRNLNAFSSPQAAKFQNITYKLNDNVVKFDGQLNNLLKDAKLSSDFNNNGQAQTQTISNIDKLKQTAFVEKSTLTSNSNTLKTGSIVFDSDSNMAAKIGSSAVPSDTITSEYVTLKTPKVHEVFKEYTLPKQTVTLNRGNISNYTTGVEDSIIASNEKNSTFSLSQNSYAGMGTRIKDPLIEFSFSNKELVAYSTDGASVKVVVDGYLGIDKIDVSGKYSLMSGYEFSAKTTEEMSIKVTSSINIKKELVLPIFGIDIDAGVGRVSGGLFLVIGLDGNFTLVTEANQWLSVKAGLKGGTFLGAPTSFNKIFEKDAGFDVEATFLGAINGYIKVGPILKLELLGMDIAGVGALIGMGVDCTVDGLVINAELYGLIEVYASLAGKKINIYNHKTIFYQTKTPQTDGYEIKFMEVCAYRKSIWGSLKKDMGTQGINPTQASLQIEVKRSNGQIKKHNVSSNQEGIFNLSNINYPLYKNDQIRISKINGKDVGSPSVSPTIPFKYVQIEYADFFNDSIKGTVNRARVKNFDNNTYEEITYTGDINLEITKDNFVDNTIVNCSDHGSFSKSYDFKPEQNVKASIVFNGFTITPNNIVKTSTDLVGQRITETISTGTSVKYNKEVDNRYSKEHFVVRNMRGSKSVDQPGIYNSRYYLYSPLSYIYDYMSGEPIVKPKTIGEKSFENEIIPSGTGSSSSSKHFFTEWVWGKVSIDTENLHNLGSEKPIIPINKKTLNNNSLLIEIENDTNKNELAKNIKNIDLDKNNILDTNIKPLPTIPQYSLNSSNFKYSSDRAKPAEVYLLDGITSIVRKGTFTIEYEGAKIVISDPDDEDKKGQPHEIVSYNSNPIAQIMIDKYWSRVNPVDVYNEIDAIQNIGNVPMWAKTFVTTSYQKGISNLTHNKNFKTNETVTRGECISFIVRTLGIESSNKKTAFNDIPNKYPYKYEVTAAFESGLVKGTGNGIFGAFDNVTREQAAVMINNGMKKKYPNAFATLTKSQNNFVDNATISGWAIEAVNNISGLAILKGYPDGSFGPKNRITFNEISALMNNVSTHIETLK